MTDNTLEQLLRRATALELLGWSRPPGRCAHTIVWCEFQSSQNEEVCCAVLDSAATCSVLSSKEMDHDNPF